MFTAVPAIIRSYRSTLYDVAASALFSRKEITLRPGKKPCQSKEDSRELAALIQQCCHIRCSVTSAHTRLWGQFNKLYLVYMFMGRIIDTQQKQTNKQNGVPSGT